MCTHAVGIHIYYQLNVLQTVVTFVTYGILLSYIISLMYLGLSCVNPVLLTPIKI